MNLIGCLKNTVVSQFEKLPVRWEVGNIDLQVVFLSSSCLPGKLIHYQKYGSVSV
jgi:hypothetical protein